MTDNGSLAEWRLTELARPEADYLQPAQQPPSIRRPDFGRSRLLSDPLLAADAANSKADAELETARELRAARL
jgi:hypothetical protein